MLKREFYRFNEASTLLGLDSEALRQAVGQGKLSGYIEIKDKQAYFDDYSGYYDPPSPGQNEFSEWRRLHFFERMRKSESEDSEEHIAPIFKLRGWFLIDPEQVRRCALKGFFDNLRVWPIGLAPVTDDPLGSVGHGRTFFCLGSDSFPCDAEPEFEVGDPLPDPIELDSIWFRASDLHALMAQTDPETKSGVCWPWGHYETALLRHLAAAAAKFWKLYDPADPSTAPTNEQVARWLVGRQVTPTKAQAIASILRADGLPTGPRK